MNILVSKNYTITDHTKWYNNRSNEADLKTNYNAMEKIMLRSAKRHLKNCDGYHVFKGSAEHIREVFVRNFKEIYQVWQQGHNILYVDLDVVFTNTYDVFNKIDLFSMFNYTDPRSTYDAHYDLTLDHFFNCGIRYYPKTMDHSVWDLGFKMLENFDWGRWDSEQIIYNAMQWSQSTDPYQFLKPNLAYQLLQPQHAELNDIFNGIPLEHAAAVHVHGSRGSSDRLQLMKLLEAQ